MSPNGRAGSGSKRPSSVSESTASFLCCRAMRVSCIPCVLCLLAISNLPFTDDLEEAAYWQAERLLSDRREKKSPPMITQTLGWWPQWQEHGKAVALSAEKEICGGDEEPGFASPGNGHEGERADGA